MRGFSRALPGAIAALVLAVGCSSGDQGGGSGHGPGICDADKAQAALPDFSKSCVLSCGACDEATQPWTCPAMGAWAKLAHDCSDSACGRWDGSYPKPGEGRCTAGPASGAAAANTDMAADPVVLPDGRRLTPAGTDIVLDQDKLEGTFPASALWIPDTPFVAVSDDGYADHVLRILDTDKLAAGTYPVVSQIAFMRPDSLNYGLALAQDGTLYAASGAPDSVIRVFSLDMMSGALVAEPSRDIPVENAAPGDVFPSGIAISPDGTRLVVAQVKGRALLLYSLESTSYGKQLAVIDLGKAGRDLLEARFDPQSSDVVYVTAWNGEQLFEVDITDPSAPAIRGIPTGKQPEQIAFIPPSFLVVANSLSDTLSVLDRVKAQVVDTVPVDANAKLPGSSPSALSYDAASGRLYVALASRNGVEVFDVKPGSGTGAPPSLAPLGTLPTAWWPTAAVVADVPPGSPRAGSLLVLNGKGHGNGPTLPPQTISHGLGALEMMGSAQLVSQLDAATLTAETKKWEAAGAVDALAGQSEVKCPAGADYDFPIPRTNTEGPSKQIQHVVFIVRENKTFDGIMGDVKGVNGDPKLVLAPGKMNQIWANIRKIAGEFSQGDNFYEDAEQSIQGHFWTVFGRSSDYTERTWLSTWGRGTRGPIPNQGVSADTTPEEGGIFDWLSKNKIDFDNMGELLSGAPLDSGFGLVSTSGARPDTKGACYIAGRARLLCDMKPFSYVWLVNDHTLGGKAGAPNPGLMVSVNDEATGMIVDAISHSPMWTSTLIVVIEDDPQDGADHVDAHRSIAVFASPWVKRGYVTHTHFDVQSLHKLFAHIYGIPYNNQTTADAALPFDLFTSTPDYTPFDYQPRSYTDVTCNAAGSKHALEAQHWDFSEPDDQPGLSAQIWEMLHEE